MQTDILRKCATTTEILSLRGEIKEVEDTTDKLEQHYIKSNNLIETMDNMKVLSAQLKEMQMDSLRNQNRILENNRRVEETLSRINNLENFNKKSDKIKHVLSNPANVNA